MPGTVTVACKLPNGLILRAFDYQERREQVMGGGTREVKVGVDRGVRVLINGYAQKPNEPRLDEQGNPVIVLPTGFALTTNVDADLWENWYEANRDSDIVRNGLIFAHGKTLDVRAEAREKGNLWSGLEPMHPDGDKRMPRQRQRLKGGAIAPLETATRN